MVGKQVLKDTAAAILQTSYSLVDFRRHLIAFSHKYVSMGQFTSDHTKKEHSKLRQSCGGAYFITVQQSIEKIKVKQASMLLRNGINIESLPGNSDHHCKSCSYKLSVEGTEIFEGLSGVELIQYRCGTDTIQVWNLYNTGVELILYRCGTGTFIPTDTKMSLVHIAGYVTRNDEALDKEELFGHTKFYSAKYGQFTKRLDRDGSKCRLVKLDSGHFFVSYCSKL